MKKLDTNTAGQHSLLSEVLTHEFKSMSDAELRDLQAEILLHPHTWPQQGPLRQEEVNQLRLYQLELEIQNRELKASQAVLEESRERYAELYDNAPVGYVTLNGKGVIQDINLTAVSILERKRSLLIGLPLGICLKKGEMAELLAFLKQIAEGRQKVTMDTWVSRSDGALCEVQFAGHARFDPDSGEIQYRIAIHDITERKRIEREAQVRKDALVHMARINTVGELAASLAHELTQPLQAVEHFNHAALQLLQRQGAAQSEVLELLQGAEQQLKRAGKIIFHLRKFIRHGVVNKRPTNLNEVITAAMELMQPMLRDTAVTVRLTGEANLPAVNIEPIQIEQVLVNLMRNSVEAMTKAKSEPRSIEIKLEYNDSNIQVTVRDTGPGFNSNSLARIFDVLESDKDNGIGMGLAISRSLIKAHGGRLWADTQNNQGAVLCFTLPLAEIEAGCHG